EGGEAAEQDEQRGKDAQSRAVHAELARQLTARPERAQQAHDQHVLAPVEGTDAHGLRQLIICCTRGSTSPACVTCRKTSSSVASCVADLSASGDPSAMSRP